MTQSAFQECKAWALANSSWWHPYYIAAFPNIIRINPVAAPSKLQDAGVDKIVDFRRGERLFFEDKTRRRRKPVDVALEYRLVPVDQNREPWDGWIEKLGQLTDVLCYGFIDYNTALFIPWARLQAWYLRNRTVLHAQFEHIKAPNPPPPRPPEYFGLSLIIPRDYLFSKVEGIIPIAL